MRFTRYARSEPFTWTPKKLSAAKSKPARQAVKLEQQYPLLAAVLEAPAAFDLNVETERRMHGISGHEQNLRDFHARVWRESRRDYFAAMQTQRCEIRKAWAGWSGPTASTYYRYMVDLHTGVMDARSKAFNIREREQRSAMAVSRYAQGRLELAVESSASNLAPSPD